jgi:D-sedoheptulose 7-phosphate isomerase
MDVMDLEQRLNHQFAAHMETVSEAAVRLAGPIERASRMMVESLLQGGKILSCGNGGAASASQHFVAKMLNRYERERPGLPAIALNAGSSTMTSVADELSYSQVFAKQLEALGQPGDVLLAISSTGQSENLVLAAESAVERQISIVALTGCDGGRIAARLREHDIEIRVPADNIARIQEVQLLSIHCLCDLIDTQLLGG